MDDIEELANNLSQDNIDKLSRFELIEGPNTNQYWLYDNQEDVYVDIPKDILDLLNSCENYNKANDLMEYIILNDDSEWLQNKEYQYDDIER